MRVGWNRKTVIRIRKSIRKLKLLLSPSLKQSSQGKDTLLSLLFPPTSPKQFWHNFVFCVVVEGDDWKPLCKYILLSSQKKMQGHSETALHFTVGRTWGYLAIKITKQVTYVHAVSVFFTMLTYSFTHTILSSRIVCIQINCKITSKAIIRKENKAYVLSCSAFIWITGLYLVFVIHTMGCKVGHFSFFMQDRFIFWSWIIDMQGFCL